MGKPYAGEEWEQLWKHGKARKQADKADKFTTSFQDYLDSVPDLRWKFPKEEKQPVKDTA
jgi:hypothetical protein